MTRRDGFWLAVAILFVVLMGALIYAVALNFGSGEPAPPVVEPVRKTVYLPSIYKSSVPTPIPTPTSIPEPFVPPAGFKLFESTTGIDLYWKKYADGYPDFVQVIRLDQATLRFMNGDIIDTGDGAGGYGGDNPTFLVNSLRHFWNKALSLFGNPFCVSNAQFFKMGANPTRLAFPVKIDGKVITDGFDLVNYEGEKVIFELWDSHARIVPFSVEELYGTDAPNAIVGLEYDAGKRYKDYTGRTFLGVADLDGDGLNELAFVFNSKSARPRDAHAVLKDFGNEQTRVLMLDGGGSTQLMCQGESYVYSSRVIPSVVVTIGGKPAFITAQELLEQFEFFGLED